MSILNGRHTFFVNRPIDKLFRKSYTYFNGTFYREQFSQSGSSYDLRFIYTASGITGVIINGVKYLYLKNSFGDVTGIYDANGNLICRYIYDAWGNHKVLNPNGTENISATFIGNLNPIRYRGYYYDADLGLYYLKSRYYDSEVGRFISIDKLGYLAPTILNGLNLYAYCLNNPIANVDPTGTFLSQILIKVTNFIRNSRKIRTKYIPVKPIGSPPNLIKPQKPENIYYFAEDETQKLDGAINYYISQSGNGEPVIKIYDSYLIKNRVEKEEILRYIINTEEGRKYGLSEKDIDYYLNEWAVHNYALDHVSLAAFCLGKTEEEIIISASSVDLNTDDRNAKFYKWVGWICEILS